MAGALLFSGDGSQFRSAYPLISISWSIGLSCLISLLCPCVVLKEQVSNAQNFAVAFVRPLVAILVGYIAHLFMI
jgi:hypothetical protein